MSLIESLNSRWSEFLTPEILQRDKELELQDEGYKESVSRKIAKEFHPLTKDSDGLPLYKYSKTFPLGPRSIVSEKVSDLFEEALRENGLSLAGLDSRYCRYVSLNPGDHLAKQIEERTLDRRSVIMLGSIGYDFNTPITLHQQSYQISPLKAALRQRLNFTVIYEMLKQGCTKHELTKEEEDYYETLFHDIQAGAEGLLFLAAHG